MRINAASMEWGMVVKLTGCLDASGRERLEEYPALQSCSSHVALDLTELDFIDSTGLSGLVQLVTRFQEAGKKTVLVNPAEGVLGILKMTSVDKIVPIVENLDRAAELLAK